jgi:hypothetical protein
MHVVGWIHIAQRWALVNLLLHFFFLFFLVVLLLLLFNRNGAFFVK